MLNTTGNKRVIVTNVLPSVDGGRFRAKAIQHQTIILSADIFTDGNDAMEASVAIKHKSEKQWTTLDLKAEGNDKWTVSFEPEKLGIYQFQVQGWINHFLTWQKGLQKKYKAKQQVEIEIEIGILLAEAAEARATGKHKPLIRKWINEVKSKADIDLKVQLAFDNNITQLISKCRDKNLVTLSPTIYEIEVDPPIALYGTWYEMFPRSAATEAGRHGTFKDVKALLPYINKMGFNVLYFPPIHPIGEQHRKGKNNALTTTSDDPGSPWAIGNTLGGHKAIHPELGTLKDFKELITAAGNFDMKIAMDIAFQCAPDHPYVRLHPEWFMWRPDGTVQFAENPPKKYEDILPFNFETDAWEQLWQALKRVFIYWIEAGIEIFRVDNPHTKTFPFWEWVINEVKEEHPQVIFLAEAFTRPRIMERLAKVGFSQSYTYFAWRNTKKEIEEYITSLIKTDLKHYFRPNLWPNTPDILTDDLVTGGENAHIIRLVLAATLSSSYGIYRPVYELGINEPMPGKITQRCKLPTIRCF
jgi:starch synthase (maltosyl-transferring)